MKHVKWLAPLALAAALSPAYAQTWSKLNTGINRGASPNQIGVDIGTSSSNFIPIGTVAGGVFSATSVPFASVTNTAAQLFGAANTWTAAQTISATGTGVSYAPFWNVNLSETYAAGTNFFIGSSYSCQRTGGTGYRECIHIEQSATNASVGEPVVGLNGIGHLKSTSSGSVFGLNGYAWVDSTAASTAEATGLEANTDIRSATITRKTGLQIVDVSTSVGVGSAIDAGLWLATVTGGAGYKYGIEFSASGGTFPVKAAGSLFKTGAGTVTKGLDWTATTFTGNIIDVPRMSLDPNGQLSLTRSTAGSSLILTGFTGSDQGGEIQQTNATGGSKFTRVAGTGSWQLLNSAYSTVLIDVDDSGNAVAASRIKGTLLTTTANAPTPSTCGTGPSVDANSSGNGGKITFGSGTTACTLTFAVAFPTSAFCTVTPLAQPAAVANIPYVSAQSRTAFTISGGTASAAYQYTCAGN